VKTESTPTRIVRAARDLFDENGLEGVSMRRIAERVGITPMAIYRHYPDKGAVVNALMLDGMAAWEQRAAVLTHKDPLRWLEQLGEAFLDFALQEPRRYEAAFLLKASAARQYPGDFAAGRSPVIAMAHVRIEQARAQGRIADASAVEIGLAFSALSQGLVSMYQAGRFADEGEFRAAYRRSVQHCIRSFLKGEET
jgi:AcrR family transcriptional regulator